MKNVNTLRIFIVENNQTKLSIHNQIIRWWWQRWRFRVTLKIFML